MEGRYLKQRPNGGWGWIIVLGGLYDLSMWAGFLRCLSVFFNPLMDEFEVEYGAVSRLSGLFQIGYGVFTSLCPLVLKHFEARKICMTASLVAAVSCFIASFANRLWVVQLFMGFILGASTGFLLNCQFTMVARYFNKKHHTANQIMCMGVSLGPFIVCPGFQFLINLYGWRGATQIASAILLNTTVASALMRPIRLESDLRIKQIEMEKSPDQKESSITEDSKSNINAVTFHTIPITKSNHSLDKTAQNCNMESRDLTPNDIETAESNSTSSSDSFSNRIRKNRHKSGYRRWIIDKLLAYNLDLFIDPVFYEYTMAFTGFSITFYSALTYMIPYGEKILGLNDLEASTLISAVACGEIFSRVVYTFVLDRISERSRVLWMAIVYGILGIISSFFTFINGYIGAMAFCAIIGILGGGMGAIVNTIIADIFELHQYASALGYSNITYSVIDSIAVMLIGVTVDHFGNMKLPFYIGSFTAILSCLITVKLVRSMDRIRRERKHQKSTV